MKRVNNRYCTTCLRTRQFHEVGDHYVCERCRKMLFKVTPGEGLKS